MFKVYYVCHTDVFKSEFITKESPEVYDREKI